MPGEASEQMFVVWVFFSSTPPQAHTLDKELRAVLVEELVSHDGDGIQRHGKGFGARQRNGNRRPTHRVSHSRNAGKLLVPKGSGGKSNSVHCSKTLGEQEKKKKKDGMNEGLAMWSSRSKPTKKRSSSMGSKPKLRER
jgi:hypothetical protein